MLGLVFYSTIAAGLGNLLPISLPSGMGLTGIRFSLGYATMVISIYVAHVLMGFPLRATVTGIAVFSVFGFLYLIRRIKNGSNWPELLCHPAILLTVLGIVVVITNRGIGYLPFTHDEFSHWLATPRLIHLSGNWATALDFLHLPFYTPGWQLTLILPWQVFGKEDFGMSASAPFILHITVIALIFDIVVFQLRRRIDLARSMAMLMAWAFILLFLAAEGMGRLWTYTLLIEQPQIYAYTTVLLLIFAAEATGQDRKPLYAAAGTVLASAYLYKVAALIFIPAIVGLSCVLLFDRIKSISDRFKDIFLTTALLAGPILVAMVSWSIAVEANNCGPLSLTSEQMARAANLDWKDLAVRFGSAIGSYVVGYKLILSVAASLGLVSTLIVGRYRAAITFVVLSLAYFMILYLYHLVCFGPYYFENLNSIPRFTRVPLQMFHALGLVMLFDTALYFVTKEKNFALAASGFLARHFSVIVIIAIVVVLAGWQGRMVHRSVVDTTTRAYQIIDPRISEMRTAAKRIEYLRGNLLPEKPVLMILSQGGDSAVISYAQFFAIGFSGARPAPRFTVSNSVSWSPEPSNAWQVKANESQVAQQLSQADIIWPINLDPWLLKVLGRLVSDNACLSTLPNTALVRDMSEGETIRFRCIDK